VKRKALLSNKVLADHAKIMQAEIQDLRARLEAIRDAKEREENDEIDTEEMLDLITVALDMGTR
jgi:hypothetical protein